MDLLQIRSQLLVSFLLCQPGCRRRRKMFRIRNVSPQYDQRIIHDRTQQLKLRRTEVTHFFLLQDIIPIIGTGNSFISHLPGPLQVYIGHDTFFMPVIFLPLVLWFRETLRIISLYRIHIITGFTDTPQYAAHRFFDSFRYFELIHISVLSNQQGGAYFTIQAVQSNAFIPDPISFCRLYRQFKLPLHLIERHCIIHFL